MAGTNPSYAAKKDNCSVDRQAPTWKEEAGRGRRLGTEEIVRH